jgi:hypothetical protein
MLGVGCFCTLCSLPTAPAALLLRSVVQASGMPDPSQWPMFLAAIILYSFDLSLVFPSAKVEDNFYFRLNKAQPPTHACGTGMSSDLKRF